MPSRTVKITLLEDGRCFVERVCMLLLLLLFDSKVTGGLTLLYIPNKKLAANPSLLRGQLLPMKKVVEVSGGDMINLIPVRVQDTVEKMGLC